MNAFNIIGPIMVGPSSSHTGGAVRIGKIAYTLMDEQIKTANITLYGSFAQTYKGHGTDKALVAGIMGMSPDDTGIRNSLDIAREKGLTININPNNQKTPHPNTVFVELVGINGERVSVMGSSVGGGNIVITEINSMKVNINCQNATFIIMHRDAPGAIACATKAIAEKGYNVSNIMVTREKRGGNAVMTIEVDTGSIDKNIKGEIEKLNNMISCIILDRI
ncbi:MAG: L-serine ammonia-lyase, iron-sulfur-dependent subunit beta [Oscillospiraceae bacterium]